VFLPHRQAGQPAYGAKTFDIARQHEPGRRLLLGLIEGALQLGVAVMDTAIYDVAQMREAQAHPERHQDLIVRVWGFSARFIDLSGDMQEHIIQRALRQE
jgi:pyruvate-formate lyase